MKLKDTFANLTGYLPRYYSMLASAERLMEAEAFAPDSTETVPEEQTLNFYQTELQSLQLEHVCFTYQPPVQTEGEPPAMPVVLQDVSLTVRKGEYVVFTGPSGCGKSTLLKLLMCLYPLDSGQRFLSTKTGNQPLTPAWKSLFAYVPQGNQLLSGSIRSIVAFGDEDRAQDAFQAVADQNTTQQERQESYEKYEAEQEKRIQELEEKISAIYSRWDEY